MTRSQKLSAAVAWLGIAVGLYCAGFYLLVIPYLVLPVLIGLALGAGHPWGVSLAPLGWLLSCLLGPPQRVAMDTYYYETAYLELLNLRCPSRVQGIVLGLILSLAAAWLAKHCRWRGQRRRVAAWVLAVLCLAAFSTRPFQMARATSVRCSKEPAAKSYHFDGDHQLKALYLFQQGHNYYEANRMAFEQDGRTYEPGYPTQSLRTPLLFVIWASLPRPAFLPYFSLILALGLQAALYAALARRWDPFASLLPPLLLSPLLAYVNSTLFLLMYDYWCALAILAAALVQERWGSSRAIPVLLVALLIREFSLLPLAVLLAASAWRRRYRRIVLSLAGLTLVAIAYLIHQHYVRSVAGMTAFAPIQNRLQGSPLFALSTLYHGTIFLLGREYFMPLMLILTPLTLLRARTQPWLLPLALTSLTLFGLFCRLGNPGFAQYYGFNYIPLVLVCGSSVLVSLATLPESIPTDPETLSADADSSEPAVGPNPGGLDCA